MKENIIEIHSALKCIEKSMFASRFFNNHAFEDSWNVSRARFLLSNYDEKHERETNLTLKVLNPSS